MGAARKAGGGGCAGSRLEWRGSMLTVLDLQSILLIILNDMVSIRQHTRDFTE